MFKAQKKSLTVLKTLGRVGSVFFLRIEASVIKTQTKNKRYFRKNKSRVGRFLLVGSGCPKHRIFF